MVLVWMLKTVIRPSSGNEHQTSGTNVQNRSMNIATCWRSSVKSLPWTYWSQEISSYVSCDHASLLVCINNIEECLSDSFGIIFTGFENRFAIGSFVEKNSKFSHKTRKELLCMQQMTHTFLDVIWTKPSPPIKIDCANGSTHKPLLQHFMAARAHGRMTHSSP